MQPLGHDGAAEVARAEERLGVLRRQALAVALALVAAAAGAIAGVEQLFGVVAAAVAVGVVLLLGIVAVSGSRRDRVLELIADGRDARLDAVVRERARLVQPARVLALASSLDELRREARRPYRMWSAPLYVPWVIRELDEDIARTVGLLRTRPPEPVAMARIERLLSGARSPLYGTDGRRLREELQRIRFSLG